jgi:SAM-dependent methyltransferase
MDMQSLRAHARSADRWANRTRLATAFAREVGVRGLLSHARQMGFSGVVSFVRRQMRYQLSAALCGRWDRKYGVDTSGIIDVQNLEVLGNNRQSGHAAVSTSPNTFRYLSRFFPENWHDFTFIDVGCGKGRVVLMALQHGFKDVIGIDFAPLLCKIAEENVAAFRGKRDAMQACSIVTTDAAEFPLPRGRPLLVYCANPFEADVWEKFVPNLATTYAVSRHQICLVLSGTRPGAFAEAEAVIRRCPLFRVRARGKTPYFSDTYLPHYFCMFRIVE